MNGNGMLIFYSSRAREGSVEWDNFRVKINKSVSDKDIRLVGVSNNGEWGLGELYDKCMEENVGTDIIVFIHDDIELEEGWDIKIRDYFEKNNEYAILGLAGSNEMVDACWFKDRNSVMGKVAHPNSEGGWVVNHYSNGYSNEILPAVVVDGLFMAVMPKRLKVGFGKQISKFHFYDVEFCLDNYLRGAKIGVITDIVIKHNSIGLLSNEWKRAYVVANEKYGQVFPLKADINLMVNGIDKPLNNDVSVAVIIPSKDNFDMLQDCINSLLESSYDNFSIFVADTGSRIGDIEEFDSRNGRVKVLRYDYYHFAKINNDVVKNHCRDYDFLIFCNDDVRLLNDGISGFVNYYNVNKSVGTLGCRLHYADGSIQHDGVEVYSGAKKFNLRDKPLYHITHRHLKRKYVFDNNRTKVVGNTGAFLGISRHLFLMLGGFEEKTTECFEDVILNLKCYEVGRANYVLSNVVGYHYESYTRRKDKNKLSRENNDYNKWLKPYIFRMETNYLGFRKLIKYKK